MEIQDTFILDGEKVSLSDPRYNLGLLSDILSKTNDLHLVLHISFEDSMKSETIRFNDHPEGILWDSVMFGSYVFPYTATFTDVLYTLLFFTTDYYVLDIPLALDIEVFGEGIHPMLFYIR